MILSTYLFIDIEKKKSVVNQIKRNDELVKLLSDNICIRYSINIDVCSCCMFSADRFISISNIK